MNPLDMPGTIFDMSLLNPNPSSSKTAAGPRYRISFEVERDLWDLFMSADTSGMMIAAKAAVVPDTDYGLPQAEEEKGKYGQQAKALKLSSFFRTPAVWRAIGTDEEFRKWVRKQPCAARQTPTTENSHCAGDVVAAHVRRIEYGAGIAIKPEYATIPLCHRHHSIQHDKGESAIAPRTWLEKKLIQCISDWCWETLKGKLGFKHWNEVLPGALWAWCTERSLTAYLPIEYRSDEV